MSIIENRSISSALPSAPIGDRKRIWQATLLARYTVKRRQDLGITLDRAAELSGLELSEWCALEAGWVPEKLEVIRSIAATLRVRYMDYLFLVGYSAAHQNYC